MIRAALQRPGRLRMRLTVVAAASALFALLVLAVLVLPSLQHNLEQSRVDSLRASVLASNPGSSAVVRSAASADACRTSATPPARWAWRGSASSRSTGSQIRQIADSSTAPLAGCGASCEESADLHRDARGGREPARRAHRAC